MQRRKFLQNTGAVAAGSFILNGIPVKTFANTPLSPSFTCEEMRERIFVMVNLFGANDTLNTVIPVNQYSIYAANRPNIRILDSGANSYINLDTTLPVTRQSGLHPSMTAFKTLYDQGKLNVVHGVGYANNNRSHFKSDDLWNTAGDSTAPNFNFDSGWAGQLFDYRFPGLLGNPTAQNPDPPCVELGSTNGSILFQTSTNNNASILLTYNNASTYYNTLVAVGGPPPASYPVSDYGVDMKYVDDVQRLSNAYALRIQTVFNAGNNSGTITYPNTAIANQLKTVARLIKGGSKTNMYTVHQYGFDTHGTQVTAGSAHLGQHANLLKDLADAIKAFQDDIELLGFGDRVITATHSEFGRTIDENAGQGTDHGGVSTMFIIGKGVQPGVTGNPINLNMVFQRGLTDLQYDYRKVFAAILQDFMAHGSQPMNAARMLAQTTDKAPIVAATHIAPSNCYINQVIVPITLVSFKANLLANGNSEVLWQTTNESSSKEFEVQHSVDGVVWKKIGMVAGSNNSNSLKNYSLIHSKPSIGRNFYRLWQYDYNGGRKLYGPVNLFVKENAGFVIKSYPNPATFDFNVTITADKTQQGILQFFDVQGHLLQQQQIKINNGFNKFNFPVTKFRGYSGELIVHIKTDYDIQRTIRQIIAK